MRQSSHFCENCINYNSADEYCDAVRRGVREAVLDQVVRCFVEGRDDVYCEYFKQATMRSRSDV